MAEVALRLRARPPASRTADPGGRRPPGPPRAPAASRSANGGSPPRSRSTRSTRVLTKKPIRSSTSALVAVGDRRADAPGRAGPSSGERSTAKAAEQGHERRHPAGGAPAPRRRRDSPGGSDEEDRRRRGALRPAGRGRSVGSSSTGGAPVEVLAPPGELRLQHLAGEPAPLPDGEVGVLDRQLGQRRGAAGQRTPRRAPPARAPARPATSRRRRCGAWRGGGRARARPAAAACRAAAARCARSNGRRASSLARRRSVSSPLVRGQPGEVDGGRGGTAPAAATIATGSPSTVVEAGAQRLVAAADLGQAEARRPPASRSPSRRRPPARL